MAEVKTGYAVIVHVRRPWWKLWGNHNEQQIHSICDTREDALYLRDSWWRADEHKNVFVVRIEGCTHKPTPEAKR